MNRERREPIAMNEITENSEIRENKLEKAVDNLLYVFERYGPGHQFAEAMVSLREARGK